MDPEPLIIFNENFIQDSQPSIIHNSEPCSKAESLHQLQEPLLGQPIQIPSAVGPKSEGSKTILKKVKDIDRRLGEGWFFAYELWLYVIIVLAPSKSVFMCGWLYEASDMPGQRGKTWVKVFSILLIFALYYTYWSVRQALLHKEALRKKDEKIAAKAYSLVVWLSVHYFILCVVFLCVGRYFGYYSFTLTDGWKDFIYNIGYPCFQFISHYAIPVPISVYGSYKIKILLEQRKNLIGETEILQQQQPMPLDPLGKKLQEIDQRLDRGWFFIAYKIWLYLTPVLGIYLYGMLYKPRVSYHRWKRGEARRWGSLGYILHCLFWLVRQGYTLYCLFLLVRQAWFEIIAMKQKDVKIATKAYDSLVWFARYYLILVLINFWDFANSRWQEIIFWDFANSLWLPRVEEFKYEYAVGMVIEFFIKFIQFYLIPVGISIFGSKQVKNLLKEKEVLSPDDDDDVESSESKI